jgi:kumamolisin
MLRMNETGFTPVPGSHRAAVPDAVPAGPVDPQTRIEVTVLVRRREDLPHSLVQGPETLDHDEMVTRYGADPADLDLVARTLSERGVTVVGTDPATRQVRVSGTAEQMAAAFGTSLTEVSSPAAAGDGLVQHRARQGELQVPDQLDGVVTGVLGLDDRPQASPRFRHAAAAVKHAGYSPRDVAALYDFPADTDGTGQTVAVIELGGGFGEKDLDDYFSEVKVRRPHIVAAAVDGGSNEAGRDPNGADGEVLLDVEVIGAVAPGAHQVVYFAPNTDRGFVDAVLAAIHATPTPIAVSISWGAPEDHWTQQARTAFDQALADAAALGVTVTVASGDNGSADGMSDGKAHADFPAVSPHALACGGTKLVADVATNRITSETVWNEPSGGATGGGVSTTFDLPAWQATAGVPGHPSSGAVGRGVPDVAGVADPATGWRVLIDGRWGVIGGTSAVSPLWAGLIARLAQHTGTRFGLLQPMLYAGAVRGQPQAGFRDITSGDNGDYQAGTGWDACTGLGVPDGTALLAVLAKARTS